MTDEQLDRTEAAYGEIVALEQEVAAGDSRSLMAEIQKRKAQQQELHAQLSGIANRHLETWRSKDSVREDLEQRIQEWRGLLRRRAVQGRQILSKLIDGRLLMTPHTDQHFAYYEFEGIGTLTGLLSGIVPHIMCVLPAGAALATWELQPVQFQSKHQR